MCVVMREYGTARVKNEKNNIKKRNKKNIGIKTIPSPETHTRIKH
jgi:hypothetical protein